MSRIFAYMSVFECLWGISRYYSLMMENPEYLKLAKAIYSMHFIISLLNLLYRLANIANLHTRKIQIFANILRNLQQVHKILLGRKGVQVQKGLIAILGISSLNLAYCVLAVVTEARIFEKGLLYVLIRVVSSLANYLLLVSEMILYWALTQSTAAYLDSFREKLEQRTSDGAQVADLRFCCWKLLQIIGDIDKSFGPMLLLVLTSRNIYIEMDVYNVLQNLITYLTEGKMLYKAFICFLWTCLDLLTIFMMLFPAIKILRKVI